jgi:uroporphyrinogen decarboxylase
MGADVSITKRERLQAVLAGEKADRVPVALWRHFPVDDQDPIALAEATIAFQSEYDFDFVKVTPSSSFCVRDWGVEDVWRGDPEGTRDYTRYVVRAPADWARLRPLPASRGSLAGQVKCLDHLHRKLGEEVPYLQTVFSPLSQAKHLAGEERLLEHLRREPRLVLQGLGVIAETTASWLQAARGQGISGVFFAAQQASYRLMDREAYARFGEPFDRRVLEAAGGLWLNVLHLHGESIMFDLTESYPVHVVNWHDRETPPALREARHSTRLTLCGGLRRHETMVLGDPGLVLEEARAALRATRGRGFILGTGCVVPTVAPRGNLIAARRAVECA